MPESAAAVEMSKGLPAGGVLFAAHTREADDWDSPEGEVFNSGFSDHGFLGPRRAAGRRRRPDRVGWQSDFGRDIERPRNNSRTVRFYYPNEDSHRFTAGYEARDVDGLPARRASPASSAPTISAPIRIASPPRPPAAPSSAPTSRPRTSTSAASARGCSASARLECGVDINGRFGLERHRRSDHLRPGRRRRQHAAQRLDRQRAPHRHRPLRSASTPRWRSVLVARRPACAATTSTTKNTGGYFGDRSTGNGGGSGYAAATAGSFGGLQPTVQVARGFRDPDALGPLLSRPDRARLHHRQSRSRSRNQPAVRPRRALHRAALPPGGVLLPVPHQRPDRALSDDHRFLLLPQPRHGAHSRVRGRRPGRRSAPASSLELAAQVAEGPRARRRRLSGRHLAGQPDHGAAQAVRRARLRAGAAGVLLGATTTSARPSAPVPGYTLLDAAARLSASPRRSSCAFRPGTC